MAVNLGGFTKHLQPLDILINKFFKNYLRRKWEEYMIYTIRHTFTASGRMHRASLFLKSFNEVAPRCIHNGFIKAFKKRPIILEEKSKKI